MSILRRELSDLVARDDLTIDDLVDAADRLLPHVADEQTRYKVTDRPDVRTIRYYVTRGLLPRATGYAGGRARYGGTHLLRLLLIKKLQAEHFTLSRIERTLEDLDDETVTGLLLRGNASVLVAPPHRPAELSERAAAGAADLSAAASRVRPAALFRRLELPGGRASTFQAARSTTPRPCEYWPRRWRTWLQH